MTSTPLFSESVTGDLVTCRGIPVAKTIWIVATWYVPGLYWKLWPRRCETQEIAQTYVENVINHRHGHSHHTIIEIRLPGEKT